VLKYRPQTERWSPRWWGHVGRGAGNCWLQEGILDCCWYRRFTVLLPHRT